MAVFGNQKGEITWARVEAGGVKETEFAHCAVHDDTFVTVTEYVADLDIATPRIYHIKPLTGYVLHPVFVIQSSSPCRVQIYEDATITDDGTALTHMRNNRKGDIADNARLTTYHTPTASDNGTLIYDSYTGGSVNNPNNRVGGASRNGQELNLHGDYNYIIVITATANDTLMSFSNEYYEVPA